MHARVATWEGGDAQEVRKVVDEIKQRSESGPPEGVPAVGMMMLHQPDQQRVLGITLYESEDDLKRGHETLNSMDPPVPGAMGRRVSVDLYEVPIKLDA